MVLGVAFDSSSVVFRMGAIEETMLRTYDG